MKEFLKRNKKWLFLSLFLLLFTTACVSVRNSDGTVNEELLIYLDTGYWETIQGDGGWFNIIVWPICQLINFIAQYTDAGIAVIVVTVLVNALTSILSIKQQVSTQKMQAIQPQLQRIQAKYEGKDDQASRLRMSNEMNALYKKYDISPFGSMVTMFIQLPIILAIYQAVNRAAAVYTGSFMGIDLSQEPIESFKAIFSGFTSTDAIVILIFLLMAVCQFLSSKLPQILQKRRQKQSKVKTKAYANGGNNQSNQMNSMIYVTLAMVILFALNWPLAMSFYWLVSSCTRMLQNIIIQKFFIKDI